MSDPSSYRPHSPTRPPLPGESPFAPRSPFAEHYRPPRLGIIHLLAWTAATAVLLKFSMAKEAMQDGGDWMVRSKDAFQLALSLTYSITHAAGLVGTAILLFAKVRGCPGRFQPGHWLVLVATGSWLIFQIVWILPLVAERAGVSPHAGISGVLILCGLTGILCAAAYFCLTLACKDGLRWKTCFGVLAVANLMWGLSNVGSFLSSISFFIPSFWLQFSFILGWLIVGPTILVIVIVDLRRGPRRDWLHWVGPTMIGTVMLVGVASWLWTMFVGRMGM